jgi:hypothetical protein
MLRMFLSPVGALLAATGDGEAAARLIGAGRAFATKGPALTVLDDATQATLRSDLGGDRYDELLAEGRRLTLEQATASAVQALTRIVEREPVA